MNMLSALKRLVVGSMALLALAGTANAGYVPMTWTDHLDGTTYVAPGATYVYTHDIRDDGFEPGRDLVTTFSLAIDLFDDQRWDAFEMAQIEISGWRAGYAFDLGSSAFTSGWTLAGWVELNLLGTLTVAITSVCNILVCGDLNVGGSTLIATGYSQVPEPGAIALLGIGLLGIGLARRRRSARR